MAGEAPDGNDEDQLQRKMHLFQCWSIQESISRFWSFLRLQDGVLTMDGYVELNLAMQKALAEEFSLERAIDSAVGDWSEDVQPGQQAMSEEDFAMFLFELCTLWCGPNVSVHVYLLFLCAVFVAVTDHSGAFTLGLRRLEDVERLPETFFELLNLQGWSEDQAEATLASWLNDNVATEAQQAAVQHVQRQVFQLTHDARSVFLFQFEERMLDLVKASTKQLSKISKTTLPTAVDAPPKLGLQKPQVSPPQAIGTLALPKHIRSRSQPVWPQPRPQALPIGRLFESELVQYQGRGLGLAGQTAILAARPNVRSIVTASSVATEGLSGHYSAMLHGNSHSSMSNPLTELGPRHEWESGENSQGYSMPSMPTTAPSKPPTAPIHESLEVPHMTTREEFEVEPEEVQVSAFLEGAAMPPYCMPKKPPEVYRKQTEPMMKLRPKCMVFEAQKWQANTELLAPPFDRVLRKLPPDVRPGPGKLPPGPLAHPSEPVWFRMQHRLEVILRKQGRRAERRRKRRLRQRMFHGKAPKKDQGIGRELREYLDRSLAQEDLPGDHGEFLAKVQDRYIQERIREEQAQARGKESVLRKVVRPIYVPPPGASMVCSSEGDFVF
eukprot:symbB.v1.2.028437.t1/scaffold3016.1/size65323/2